MTKEKRYYTVIEALDFVIEKLKEQDPLPHPMVDFMTMARDEIKELEEKVKQLTREIEEVKFETIPDANGAAIHIRSGTGRHLGLIYIPGMGPDGL
jgi:protein subunit release factor A